MKDLSQINFDKHLALTFKTGPVTGMKMKGQEGALPTYTLI
jgi:hypothetical protein